LRNKDVMIWSPRALNEAVMQWWLWMVQAGIQMI
jgi:hypothetical protein